MLVLSRRTNEAILIDGNIRITVTRIHGNQVSLGIEAPGSVGIYREELRRKSKVDHDPSAVAFRLRNRSRTDSSQSSAGRA
jgi:carbon storage regulator